MILLINISKASSNFAISKWFSGFLHPVSVSTTSETAILVVLALRIPMRLVQRLVRSCPDPLGLGASHHLCVWTETGEALEGSEMRMTHLSSLCHGTSCTTSNYRGTPKTHTKLLTCCHTLFYTVNHVQHDFNLTSLTQIQICLLLF